MSTQRKSHRHTSRRRSPTTDLPQSISVPHRSSSRPPNKSAAALILGFTAISLFQITNLLHYPQQLEGRRSLLSTMYLSAHSTLLPWAEHNLVDIATAPDPTETALFWHIPKSGGTTAKRLYQCMGQTLAHRVGADPRFGHASDKEIVVFEPHAGKDWKVVNVDTTIRAGIVKAKNMGLVQSRAADLIFTMEPAFAGEKLYDEENKGRFLSLFRHPVDRAVSMFYYLQSATWERTYRPEWADMTVLEWANLPNAEEDYMVHKLCNKSFGEPVTETDLIIAKELVRQRFVVGLMNEMEESIRRFNIALGLDVTTERNAQCMEDFFPKEAKEETPAQEGEKTLANTDNKNSNKHPKFDKDSPEYKTIADRNPLDMILYQYIEKLFEEQKEIIDHYYDNTDDSTTDNNESASVSESDVDSDSETPAQEAARDLSSEQADEADATDSKGQVGVPEEVQANIINVSAPFEQSKSVTPFFWHVPKCGGTSLQRLYWCMGMSIANEVGGNPKFAAAVDRSTLQAFKPWTDNPGKVVNVDVSTHQGIMDANRRGFLREGEQPEVDFISTSEFQFAYTMLYSPEHRARMFAMFRHPIERQVSKFFYLRKATWEPTYNERWQKMSLTEWSLRDRGENNWMVRKLVGKDPTAELVPDDLEVAKEIIRTKFLIGLSDRYQESIHRFNYLLGVDESTPRSTQCIQEFTDLQASNKRGKKNEGNSYEHPEAREGSPAWKSLAQIHHYDVELFKFIRQEYGNQAQFFEGRTSVE